MPVKTWDFYKTAAGAVPVHKELDKHKLNAMELAKLQTIMDRIAEGRAQPKDVKSLRDGVLEVRVRVGKRQLRMTYAEGGDGLILLALHFFQKQRQVEATHIDLAVSRLEDWRSRTPNW
ncbi:hypothetical protein Ahu01nite_028630 [Winogradskya humida]|uniref:Type II toxin-antitoxin system RelE/ParE family toxin n=1 Tax=Winogradskya humida TaxID=113566 RepID=A0ABQ3ZME5_9ACTN|nr:hypothetical protein Ahu01nite_028630 [Actinoplanes humidus]